jgi:hypothetical protein
MPFLDKLQSEANMRCKTLRKALADLKMGKHKNKRERVVDGLTAGHNAGKRRKIEISKQPMTPSLFEHLRSHEYVISNQSSACDYDEDCIVKMKMKYQLWTSLLSSLKEIVD